MTKIGMVIFLSILFDLVVILNATVFKIRDQLSSTGTVMALLALQMVNLVTVLVLGKNRELLRYLLPPIAQSLADCRVPLTAREGTRKHLAIEGLVGDHSHK
jgi:hypothetical protein